MTELVQIVTTIDSRQAAETLADQLVAEHLAACVQIAGPIASTYRWQGALEHATEWVCTAKTTRQRADALLARLRALHSYEQPEILVTPVLEADPGYAAWVESETTPRS
ncbi:MAG: divalent-cation tolerance protein CutA [Gemmatimonadales bacterium]